MSELKPCPFCGVTGETEVDCGGSKDRWWARCYNPNCLYDVSTNIFDTEEKAIAAWNTRTTRLSAADADELVRLADAWAEAKSAMSSARAWFCEFGDKEYEDSYDFLREKVRSAQAAFAAKIKELRG